MTIEEGLLYILENYLKEKNRSFKRNKLATYLRRDIKVIISEKVQDLKHNKYLLTGSAGAGNWAEIPWICIFRKKITTSAQKGIYIVFLFSADMNKVYLSLNQGYTYFKENKMTHKISEVTETIRKIISEEKNIENYLKEIDLKAENQLGKGYEMTNIISKVYTIEDLKTTNTIKKDIKEFLEIYDYLSVKLPKGNINLFYDNIINNECNITDNADKIKDLEKEPKEIIDHIHKYTNSKGFIYDKWDIANLYLSIKTKPFVLLAGISGTGKSKMIELFAEAIGANKENERYEMISVKPDWNDGTDLFGYIDINGDFNPGLLTKIIYEANKLENLNKPYFICLDEMNLARVEYYLSEYLSLIETRKKKGKEIVSDPIFSKNYFLKETIYQDIYFSDNINIIGTVNMDDTTFAFSEKVLDRANTIEYSKVNLEELNFYKEEADKEDLSNEIFKTSYLTIKDAVLENRSYVEKINNKIIDINNILEEYDMHFGYRIRDEIVFYMLENEGAKVLNENIAFDFQIMQKILPKITGSDYFVEEALIELFNYLNPGNHIIKEDIDYLDKINIIESKYKMSSNKIEKMLRGYENGYVSFWKY